MKRSLMHLATNALMVIVAAALLEAPATATKPPSDTPVASTIDGLGVDTVPTLRIQSDQAGSYRNSSSLQSILQAAVGDWVLDTLNFNSSPQRKVLVDLRDPVPGSGPNGGAPTAPFAYQLVRARFIEQCSVYGIDMRTIPGGSTVYCPLVVAFDDAGGVRYRITMRADNFSEMQSMEDRTQRCPT